MNKTNVDRNRSNTGDTVSTAPSTRSNSVSSTEKTLRLTRIQTMKTN